MTQKLNQTGLFSNEPSQKSKSFAVFEQEETLSFLPYLHQKDQTTLLFKSSEDMKREKEFSFHKIVHLQDKIVPPPPSYVEIFLPPGDRGRGRKAVTRGEPGHARLRQRRVQKIKNVPSSSLSLIGESQNCGLLLSILSELF